MGRGIPKEIPSAGPLLLLQPPFQTKIYSFSVYFSKFPIDSTFNNLTIYRVSQTNLRKKSDNFLFGGGNHSSTSGTHLFLCFPIDSTFYDITIHCFCDVTFKKSSPFPPGLQLPTTHQTPLLAR